MRNPEPELQTDLDALFTKQQACLYYGADEEYQYILTEINNLQKQIEESHTKLKNHR